MNLPMYILLKRKSDAIDSYTHYNNLYKDLESMPPRTDVLYNRLKYYKNMRDVYKRKWHEINMVIHRKKFPWT
jgi:hypothetical protein